MGVRKLAEAIIMQSLDDLSDARHRSESIDFFTGEGFGICAGIAGMGIEEKLRLMDIVKRLSSQNQRHSGILGSFRTNRHHQTLTP
jgi:hypothetical protein